MSINKVDCLEQRRIEDNHMRETYRIEHVLFETIDKIDYNLSDRELNDPKEIISDPRS